MEKLGPDAFDALTRQGTVLERDPFGIKVLETGDHRIIKLFRLKRNFSSARLIPYAVRFKHNSEHLRALGIVAPAVERIAYCPTSKRHLLSYRKLEGRTLREALSTPGDHGEIVNDIAHFIAVLHEKGVYFRSLHLGNILVLPDGRRY